MPAERFNTEELLTKFAMKPKPPVPKKAVWGSGKRDAYLHPYRFGNGERPLPITPEEWRLVHELSRKGGFHGLDEDGMTTDRVRTLARALRKADDDEYVGEREKEFVDRL